MSITHHGYDVTASIPANPRIVPLASIEKRHSSNVDFTVKVLGPIELTKVDEADVAFTLRINCEMDNGQVARLGEFKSHAVESCAVEISNTALNVSDDEAASIFADFYSVARTDGTFPNRIWLLGLCRRANGE